MNWQDVVLFSVIAICLTLIVVRVLDIVEITGFEEENDDGA